MWHNKSVQWCLHPETWFLEILKGSAKSHALHCHLYFFSFAEITAACNERGAQPERALGMTGHT